MKFLSKGIKATWNDGSIPKKAKTEFFDRWRTNFHTTTYSRFIDLINLDAFPTPIEESYIVENVNQLWTYFNSNKDFFEELRKHEKENKPIIKRPELLRLKKSLPL